ncbi:MAG: tail fiber domain-containing protein [Phycisphaerales bacterium]
MKDACKGDGRTEKKPYVEPRLEKSQKLEEVTQGETPVVTGGVGVISDAKLKENIRPVEDALGKVRQLAAYRYNYIGSDMECIGLLAQEVEKVLPEAVLERDGAKMVNLYALQSLLVGAIRELRGSDSLVA